MFRKIAAVFIITVFSLPLFAQEESSGAVNKLLEGNFRFLNNQQEPKDYLGEVNATAESQSPYVIILSCADSRVPPEIIFDESIGKLFVIRVAGNVTTPEILGTIEYGVEVLKSNQILVLGHSHCGAVKSAASKHGYTPNIDALLARIHPAVDAVEGRGVDGDKIEAIVEENVELQMRNLLEQSEVLKKRVSEGTLKINGAVYMLETGQVGHIK